MATNKHRKQLRFQPAMPACHQKTIKHRHQVSANYTMNTTGKTDRQADRQTQPNHAGMHETDNDIEQQKDKQLKKITKLNK